VYRENSVLKKLEFEGHHLLIECGKQTYLDIVFVGSGNSHLRRWARRTVTEIEEKFGHVLESWVDNMNAMVGVRDILEGLLQNSGGVGARIRNMSPKTKT